MASRQDAFIVDFDAVDYAVALIRRLDTPAAGVGDPTCLYQLQLQRIRSLCAAFEQAKAVAVCQHTFKGDTLHFRKIIPPQIIAAFTPQRKFPLDLTAPLPRSFRTHA